MKVTDLLDKEEAREKKREKKRKRKERENEENMAEGGGARQAELAPLSDDDGYVSPEFDFPDESDDGEDDAPPPAKRGKFADAPKNPIKHKHAINTLEDEE
ncbi:hypothetical protein H0H93_005136, partial [Arthromyces matolae]